MNRSRLFFSVFFSVFTIPVLVLAHSAERGLVMLLPTQYYAWGAALSVAASFILLTLIPAKWIEYKYKKSLHLCSISTWNSTLSSCISFIFLLTLTYIGFTGSQDPLANLLPLMTWTGWWIIFTLLQFFIGNLWTHINPWSGPLRIVQRLLNLDKNLIQLPKKIYYLPALLLFFAFAWFELVDVAPQDPARLASVILIYWSINFIAILIFGEKHWLCYAEPFSVFFRLIGRCAIIKKQSITHNNHQRLTKFSLCWPGNGLINSNTLPWTGVLFVILTLSSVSFDGLSKTFFWMSLFDINPLLFPGRSAVILINTLGIGLSFALLGLLFIGCSWGGNQLLSTKMSWKLLSQTCGRLIYCLIPISLGFHFSHFLTTLLIDGQYLLHALNDPLQQGWNLLGLAGHPVTASFLNNIDSVSIIWKIQTLIIVIAHIVSVIMAHLINLDIFKSMDKKSIALSQTFMVFFMVAYTVFGLWLLSTASIG